MHMNMTSFMGVATPAPLANRIAAPVHQIRARALKDRPFSAQKGSLVPGDLMIVCLWSTAGLVLTGLLASLGFGDQIAQFLASAG
jgi:hypothetical protein